MSTRHPWLNACLFEFRLMVHAFAQPRRSRAFRPRRRFGDLAYAPFRVFCRAEKVRNWRLRTRPAP